MPLALSLHTSTLPAPPLKPQRLRRSPTTPSCTPGLRKGSGGRYGNGLYWRPTNGCPPRSNPPQHCLLRPRAPILQQPPALRGVADVRTD